MSKRFPLILWGAAGHARVIADAVQRGDLHELEGFVDDLHPERTGEIMAGRPILGGREVLAARLKRGPCLLIMAIGDNAARLRKAAEAEAMGYTFATVIHPSAVIASNVKVGAGTFIAAGAVINPATVIGRHAIINTNSSVDHDNRIADGVHIAPGAVLAGHVSVGQATMIGAGAVVIHHRAIGAGTMIGAGAVVIDDIGDNVTAVGVPARILS